MAVLGGEEHGLDSVFVIFWSPDPCLVLGVARFYNIPLGVWQSARFS